MLDLALTPATWQRYWSSLIHFHNFCKQEEVDFPLEQEDAVATITNFIEVATHALQCPLAMINSLLAVISTLYKPLNLFPMHNPLIKHLHCTLVHN